MELSILLCSTRRGCAQQGGGNLQIERGRCKQLLRLFGQHLVELLDQWNTYIGGQQVEQLLIACDLVLQSEEMIGAEMLAHEMKHLLYLRA